MIFCGKIYDEAAYLLCSPDPPTNSETTYPKFVSFFKPIRLLSTKIYESCKNFLIGIEKIVKVRIRSFGSGNIGFGEQDIRLESSPPLQ